MNKRCIMKNNLEKLIGNTPLICIKYKFQNRIKHAYFKCEWYNLTGSIKDRVALQILLDAKRKGQLKDGQTIAETTSGNMGIAFAGVGAKLGHKVIICMPKFMSDERKALIKLYGAKLILVSSFAEGFELCNKMEKEGVFLTRQFENSSNAKAYIRLAKEVEEKLDKKRLNLLSGVVAGVGTSGTLMGLGKYMKNKYNAKVIAVEPSASSLFSTGVSHGHHEIQGLSDNIIPALYQEKSVDQIIGVSDDESIAMAQKLGRVLGLSVGISGGANFVACVKYGKTNTLSVFPDDSKKYLSTRLSKEIKSSLVDDIQLLSYKVL